MSQNLEQKEKPILFSTPMVYAISERRKNRTRRVIPEKILDDYYDYLDWVNSVGKPVGIPCYFKREKEYFTENCKYQVGDILWVRETWRHNDIPTGWKYHYYAGAEEVYTNKDNERWKPSIFMPKEAARLFLKVTGIRAEKLWDISKEDAIAEGIEYVDTDYGVRLYKNYQTKNAWEEDPIASFRSLWKSINGEESWNANPWVWVIEFELIED